MAIAALVGLSSCERGGEDVKQSGIILYNDEINAGVNAETLRFNYDIKSRIEGEILSIECTEEWVTIDKIGETIVELSVADNSGEERVATLNLSYGAEKNTLRVRQAGYEAPLVLTVEDVDVVSVTFSVATLDEIYAQCDYITLHVPLLGDTKGMINEGTIAKMKDGVRILNFARDGLVVSADIAAGLNSGKIGSYVTDFATDDLLDVPGVVPMPHLGASTPESEDNCAIMAADEVKQYLELGNVKNSVNFPCVSMPRSGDVRFCVFHQNTPKVIANLLDAIGGNVENMENKSRGDFAYTIIDVTGANADAQDKIAEIDGIIRLRVL